jgi:hypothetical protein
MGARPGYVLITAAGVIAALMAPAKAQQTAPSRGLDDPVVAFNLADVNDWGSNMPFLDIGRTMRPFIAGTDDDWETLSNDDLRAGGLLDDAGWPRRIPRGAELLRAGFDWSAESGAAASRSGRYVLTYEGTGQVEVKGGAEAVESAPGRIVFDNPSGTGFWLEIPETDPAGSGDHVRDIRIIREDRLSLYQAGAIFNPDWLRVIRDARQLRFMDWMQTNGSEIESWDDRPRTGDATWAGKGVPVEIMVRLANEIGAEPWFTLPHKANDAYVREFATYVRDHLDPRLKVRVEFSNEVWNGGFDQSGWVDDRAREEWNQDAGLYFHARRATEMALIWQGVFGNQAPARLVNVMSGQTVNSWLTDELLVAGVWQEQEPGTYVRPDQVFEEFAVTSYFGGQAMADRDTRSELLARMKKSEAGAADWLTSRLRDPAVEDSIPSTLAYLAKQRDVANRHGLRLVLYEGGQHVHHLFALEGLGEDEIDRLDAFMRSYVRSPDMGQLYKDLWHGWQKIGQGPFMQFTDVATPSKWGSWGLFAFLGDTTPRADQLERLSAGGGSWWGEGGGAQFRQGVTAWAGGKGETLAGTPEEDYLIGGAGDDTFIPGAGSDGLNGGAGTDTVVVAGAPGDYTARREGAGIRLSGAEGDTYLRSVERIAFGTGEKRDLQDIVGN